MNIDPGIIAAIITSAAGMIGLYVQSKLNFKKANQERNHFKIQLEQIHILVNSRLAKALSEIERLRKLLDAPCENCTCPNS